MNGRRDVAVAVEAEVAEQPIALLGRPQLAQHRRAGAVGAGDRRQHGLGRLGGLEHAALVSAPPNRARNARLAVSSTAPGDSSWLAT